MGDGYQGRAAIRSFWDSGSDSTCIGACSWGNNGSDNGRGVSCCIALRPQTGGPNSDRLHCTGRNRRHSPRSSDRGRFRGGRYVVCLDIHRQHTGGWGNKEEIGREEEGGRRPCFESDKKWNSFYQWDLADSRKIECPG